VARGTKLVLLHQGLWYFELTPEYITRARLSFERISSPKTPLPFVALTKEFLSIKPMGNKSNLFKILMTVSVRRRKFNSLAKYAEKLPIVGEIGGITKIV
jgi:hypothetical protein